MSIIDPEGLFGGDRLRRCSNAAQLHWTRLFLASDGFARLEINYARIIGRAYPTFRPHPSETELQAWIQEYAKNYLIFLYEVDGQLWGQWDTRLELLPRYKTAADRRSPQPPEAAFIDWKRRYREENKSFPKCFGNISAALQSGVGVGVGVGKNICASPDGNAHMDALSSIDNPPFETTEPEALFPVKPLAPSKPAHGEMTPEQERWFTEWWSAYWKHTERKRARAAFRKLVSTEARFQQILAATRAQTPEMLSRPQEKRPYPTTWLNGERWEDETVKAPQLPTPSGTIYRDYDPEAA